jgi:hypothetical protein
MCPGDAIESKAGDNHCAVLLLKSSKSSLRESGWERGTL